MQTLDKQAGAASPHPGLSYALFVLMIASLQAMSALGVDSMLANLPAIATQFGIERENERQLVVTAYLIGFGATQIIYGPLSDRFGRRPLLIGGVAIYVLFSALAAFSPSFGLLIVARVFQGAGAAGARSLPISVVRDCYAGRRMAKVMSLSFMTFMAVPMLAPGIGQAIALFASWRWVFGFLALYGAAILLWIAIKLPETLHPEDRVPIQWKSMAHSFGIALRSRTGMGYALAQSFIMGAVFGFINSVQEVFQYSLKASALFPVTFAFVAGCISVASLLNASLVERLGMRRLSHGALIALICVSIAHTAVAMTGHETILTFALLQGAVMFGFGLITGNFGSMAMEPLGHVAGAAAALQGCLSTFGGSLIGFLIGQQFDGTVRPLALGYAICGLLALACVAWAEHGRLFRGHQASQPKA